MVRLRMDVPPLCGAANNRHLNGKFLDRRGQTKPSELGASKD